MTTFLDDWRKFYGELPPLSFALRNDERWVRFHSLPASKRYAQSPSEEVTVLHRANTVASDVIGADISWLAQSVPLEPKLAPGAARSRQIHGLMPAGSFVDDEVSWTIFATITHFRPGAFDNLIRDIAEERAFRTIWLSTRNGIVFAPYDGGIDVFMETAEAADTLKVKHRYWLSARADGL
ncbi:MAG: hypothetical protein H7124_06930 [Phycisphaerales bacterium]|nr:hypothetical protein [Hyphomonadaceae bacterium]